MVIPISFLLALSFFVLLSIDKAQTKKLKNFGYLVALVLWLAVLVIVLGGADKLVKGGSSAQCMMKKKMSMHSASGMPGMRPEQMPAAMDAK